MDKTYLGDAVYVEHDGFGLTLTTEDGINKTNEIYLEPNVYKSLEEYVKNIKNKKPVETVSPDKIPNFEEIMKLIGKVDISTQEKMERFTKWKFEDGSLEGLKEVMKLNGSLV